ncbi:hypothetical protein HMPREF9120_01159 [Neisseria sp. oral taxon 020 str. F0370]|nr:hypothetical protein HMPREF9120_01159 [Neisseria sp. oral taxon 020 str. F0370]
MRCCATRPTGRNGFRFVPRVCCGTHSTDGGRLKIKAARFQTA